MASKAAGSVPVFEIEIDGPRNEQLFFRPTRGHIRGKFDWTRAGSDALSLGSRFGNQPIPGQRLRLEGDKLSLIEPLQDEQHKPLADQIAKRFGSIPENGKPQQVDVDTVAHFMNEAVQAGLAKVTAGECPPIDESKVRRDFVIRKAESTDDKLATALNALAKAVELLTSKAS